MSVTQPFDFAQGRELVERQMDVFRQPPRKKKHMLEVTARAKEKLREALFEEQRADPEIIFRITPIHSMPDQLGIALDKENGGDQVVESEDGIKVLLIESHLAQKLKGMVLDYQEKPQGKGFRILKLPFIEPRQGKA